MSKVDKQFIGWLNRYIDEGYIRVQKHPTKDLFIYNYTQEAQSKRKWDDITRACRGLVLDSNRNIVIECPRKFFNKDEPEAATIDWNNCIVSEKLDGYYISCKIDYNYGILITSRGSFDNQYTRAVHKFLTNEVVKQMPVGYTYFFELLENFKGDEGVILTKHPTPELVCWAAKDESNKEIYPIDAIPRGEGIRVAETMLPDEIDRYLQGEVEGVVVRDTNTNDRIKIKTQWFIDNHRLIAHCTPKHIWELLRSGDSIFNHDLPDEFMKYALETENVIKQHFKYEHNKVLNYLNDTADLSDKELGLSEIPVKYKGVIFAFRKGKTAEAMDYLWKTVKP